VSSAALFVVGLVLLYVGGEGLVRGAAALGIRFGMSPLVAGLTIVAFATSAPELAISVDAATREIPGLSVGNVVGSNICNITLIFGLTSLLSPPALRAQLVRRDVLVMLLSALLVPCLLLDGRLGRIEGALLCLSVLAYVVLTVYQTRASRLPPTPIQVPTLTSSIWLNLVVTAVSVALLVFGSELFVKASVDIAAAIGVPAAVVGLSAAALGSSLPELSASVISARHGHPEMAAGNLIGSNIFNLLSILGVTALVNPVSSEGVTYLDLVVMIGVTVLALALMVTRERVSRAEGGLLVTVYIAYLALLFGAA
jgi:cation:H+ antiporter